MRGEEKFEVVDQSTDAERVFVLYVGDGPRVTLSKKTGGPVELHWEVSGPQYWRKARPLIHGLLHLTVLADELQGDDGGSEDE